MNNICPKCKKGQIVCTYLGPLNDYHLHHGWRHDCTNPTCSFSKTFRRGDSLIANVPGPGKEGLCPGHR